MEKDIKNESEVDKSLNLVFSFQNTDVSIPSSPQFLAITVPRETVIRLANGKRAFNTHLQHYK